MPDGGTSATVAAAIGRARAMRMALLAEPLTAREAYDAGLVSHVAADAEFPALVDQVVRPADARARRWPRRPPRRRSTPPPSTSSSRPWSASAPGRRSCCAPTTPPRGCAPSARAAARSSAATEPPDRAA